MPRTPLDALLTERVLTQMSIHLNASFLDCLLDENDSAVTAVPGSPLPIKNVCAKVHESLSDEIDEVVGLLNLSKRAFLEAAFIEAIIKARQVISDEGLEDYLVERTAQNSVSDERQS